MFAKRNRTYFTASGSLKSIYALLLLPMFTLSVYKMSQGKGEVFLFINLDLPYNFLNDSKVCANCLKSGSLLKTLLGCILREREIIWGVPP